MSVALLSSTTSSTPVSGAPYLSPPTWMEPYGAELTIRHAERDTEHHSVRLLPRAPRGQMTILSRDGQGGETEQTRIHQLNSQMPPPQQAAQMLATFFFGGNGLLPRIVGTPEWASASLVLSPQGVTEESALINRLDLQPVIGPSPRGVMTCRQLKAGVTTTLVIYLRPADADPIYALLRVALGLEIARAPG